jgi:hypothetical protein
MIFAFRVARSIAVSYPIPEQKKYRMDLHEGNTMRKIATGKLCYNYPQSSANILE